MKVTVTDDTDLSKFSEGFTVNGTTNTVKEVSTTSPYSITLTGGSYAATDNTGVLGGATTVTQSRYGYGTNGFHLDFSDPSSNASLGYDAAGSNNWSVNNLTAFIPAVDVGGDPTVSSSDKPFTTGHSVAFDGNDKLRVEGPGTVSGDFTWECWVKFTGTPSGRFFSAEESVNGTEYSLMRFYGGNLNVYVGGGSSYEANTYTGTVSADTWHHIAMVRSGNTVSHYLDGSRWDTNTYSNSFTITTLVLAQGYGSEYFTGSISNARFVNGQALYTGASYTVPTATLTTTSQSATASNVTTLVAHKASVTANDGTKTGIGGSPSDIDSLLDTPTDYDDGTNIGGNYCTLNPLKSRLNLSNGNLDSNSPSGWKGAAGTIGMSSGKFYWEIDNVQSNEHVVGIVKYNTSNVTWNTTYGYGAEVGVKYLATGGVAYGAAWTTGDVIGVAFDADNGILEFYKNGVSQGVAATGLTDGPYLPSMVHNGTSRSASINFGQRPWKFTPKANHVALCTQNLTDPLIDKGSDHFKVVTWTGTAASKSLTTGFSPDLIWAKNRSTTANHRIFDTVRGVGLMLHPNKTDANQNDTNNLTSFDSTGFTVGTNSYTNGSGNGIVAWAWDGGDLATNSAYNQSQVWSNGTYSGTTPGAGYEVANAFNGSNSPGDSFAAGKIWGFFPGSGTLTLPTPITLTSSSTVEFYTWHNTSSTGNITVTCSNGSVAVTPVNNANIASTTVSNPYSTFGASITAITVNSSGSDWTALAGVVIDGKLLVDTGVIPAGSLNSSAYNQSYNISPNISTSVLVLHLIKGWINGLTVTSQTKWNLQVVVLLILPAFLVSKTLVVLFNLPYLLTTPVAR